MIVLFNIGYLIARALRRRILVSQIPLLGGWLRSIPAKPPSQWTFTPSRPAQAQALLLPHSFSFSTLPATPATPVNQYHTHTPVLYSLPPPLLLYKKCSFNLLLLLTTSLTVKRVPRLTLLLPARPFVTFSAPLIER